MYDQILIENDEMQIERASHTHPGFDSALDLALRTGACVIGHIVHKNAGNGCDCFGRESLVIACENPDDSIKILYRFTWRWNPEWHNGRGVLGWWYGDGEWDVEYIHQYSNPPEDRYEDEDEYEDEYEDEESYL